MKKQRGKSRKRKTMRGVVMSSLPHLAPCGSSGMLWSGRRGLIQPFLSSWSANASLPFVPVPVPACPFCPLTSRLSLCLNFIIKLTEILLGVWADSCIEFWFIVWFIRAVDGRLGDLVLQKYLGMQHTAISALLITIIIKINVPPQSFRWLCHSI